jgi:predicted methyltransferase
MLTFLGASPGMRAAVLGAGSGYTTELVARAVAPGGTVYAENPGWVLGAAEQPWAARLATPAMRAVQRLDRELDDPLPSEVADLDLVSPPLSEGPISTGITGDPGFSRDAGFLVVRRTEG